MVLQSAESGIAKDKIWHCKVQNLAMREIMHGGMEGEI